MQRQWKTAFLTILDYQTMPASEVIESLKRVGYEGIEWTVKGHFDPDRGIAPLKDLVARTRDAGMGVSQVMDHKDLIGLDEGKRRETIQRTVRVIEAAGECGIAAVSVLTGPAIWEPGHVVIGQDMSEGTANKRVRHWTSSVTQRRKQALQSPRKLSTVCSRTISTHIAIYWKKCRIRRTASISIPRTTSSTAWKT